MDHDGRGETAARGRRGSGAPAGPGRGQLTTQPGTCCGRPLAGLRTRLRYKQAWYGTRLVEADRWFPSSQLCSACGHQAAIGWAEEWDCPACGAHHHRDDNAAVNLARYPACGWQPRAVGPVGSPVKRRADRKTGPRPAGGVEAPNPNPERGAA